MSRGPYDGLSRATLRVGLAAVAAVDTVSVAHLVATTPRSPISHPAAPEALLALGGSAAFAVPAAAVGVTALFFFARARATLVTGAIALAVLALLDEVYAALSLGPSRAYFYSGALLLGWLLGTGYARALRPSPSPELASEEPFAEAGAASVLAAIYVSAGLSKLLHSGISWADQMTLRAIVLAHHRISDTSLSAAYAHFIVARPWLSQTLSVMTLGVQLGAVVYLTHPGLRKVWGALIIGFHLNVSALTGIGYLEAQVLVLLFSYPWPAIVARLRGRPRPDLEASGLAAVDPARGRRVRRVALGAAVALIAIAWLSPIRRYTGLHHQERKPPGHGGDRSLRSPS